MTAEEALRFIIDRACGRLSKEESERAGGTQEHLIELCCRTILVTVRRTDQGIEIVNVEEHQ